MQEKSNLYSYTSDKVKKSLTEKSIIVKSFIAPEYVRSEQTYTLTLTKRLRDILANGAKLDQLLLNIARSEKLPNFYNNTIKEKSFSFKENNLFNNTKQNKGGIFKASSNHNKQDIPVISKKYDIITVTKAETKVTSNNKKIDEEVFSSYIEKLEKITAEIKKISSTKLPNNTKLGKFKTSGTVNNFFSNYSKTGIVNSINTKAADNNSTTKDTESNLSNVVTKSAINSDSSLKEKIDYSKFINKNKYNTKSESFESFIRDSKNTVATNSSSSNLDSELTNNNNAKNSLTKQSNYSNTYFSYSNKNSVDDLKKTNVIIKQEPVLSNINEEKLLNALKDIVADIKSSLVNNNNLLKNSKEQQHKEYLNLEHKQQEAFNKLLLGLDSKLEVLTQKILPYFDDIKKGITKLIDKDDYKKTGLKQQFVELDSKLEDLKKICDLNGLDIDSLHDALKDFNSSEILRLLRSTNVHIHSLVAKQEKLTEQENIIATEIKNLEQKINNNSQKHFSSLLKQIKETNEKQQDESFSNSEYNRKKLVDEFKFLINDSVNKISNTENLQEKLNDLLLRQEDLLKAALNIKSHVLDSNKELSSIKSSNNSDGVVKLIEELKSNSTIAANEQDAFNKKIHDDMDFIKKSIIKLVEERKKEFANQVVNNNVVSANEANKVKHKNVNNSNTLQNDSASLKADNIASSKPNVNVVEAQEVNNNTKEGNTKENKKATQIKMAISKLKEALDLEAINTVQELHHEYIDEIIEDKIHNAASEHKNKLVNNQTAANNLVNNAITKESNIKKEQTKVNSSNTANDKDRAENKILPNTFILDNSKFFK